jgi:hypothetical protein
MKYTKPVLGHERILLVIDPVDLVAPEHAAPVSYLISQPKNRRIDNK